MWQSDKPQDAIVENDSVFPDWLFPTSVESWSEYRRLVELGQSRMRGAKVVICGLARDVADILPQSIARIERLGEHFADYRVVIYENDSRDATPALLADWTERNHRVQAMRERIGDPINPTARCLRRAARMANYRNRCLEVVRSQFADFDYVIVVDTDLQGGWSDDGVANTFGHEAWDFVGSNGIIFKRQGRDLNVPIQFDAWAFRRNGDFAALTTTAVNCLRWQRGESLAPVTSCFGGFGVYRMPALLSARYAGWDCEHIPLHFAMRRNGFHRVFLNPSQITLYGRRHRSTDRVVIPILNGLARLRRVLSPQALAAPIAESLCLGMKS